MRAGKLDRILVIERATLEKTSFNEDRKVWAPIATVWAQQRPNRGDERFTAAEVAGRRLMTFHIRFRSDLGITITDRIVYDNTTWDILDVREVGRRVVTEIDAVARGE